MTVKMNMLNVLMLKCYLGNSQRIRIYREWPKNIQHLNIQHILNKDTPVSLFLYTIFNIFKAFFSSIFIYIANNR